MGDEWRSDGSVLEAISLFFGGRHSLLRSWLDFIVMLTPRSKTGLNFLQNLGVVPMKFSNWFVSVTPKKAQVKVRWWQREGLFWFRCSLAAVGCGLSVVEGERLDVTPAAVAHSDGPSVPRFMWNHFPSRGSHPTHREILIYQLPQSALVCQREASPMERGPEFPRTPNSDDSGTL